MAYGVTPAGFVRKPLDEILLTLEDKAKETFGAGVIQTPASPLGQLNGMMASIIATTWELAEDVYQSYDPRQATGFRIDQLATIRLLSRVTGEDDESLRAALTNQGKARIDESDLVRAIMNVTGVTYARLFVNSTDATDADGVPARSIALAVLGGDDDEVAATLRRYVAPGVSTWGYLAVDTVIDGFCRTVYMTRPTEKPTALTVNVRLRADRFGCPPPSVSTIAAGLAVSLNGDGRLVNGQDVSDYEIRSRLESSYPQTVEFVSATWADADVEPFAFGAMPRAIPFNQIATFAVDDITIVPVT